MNKKSFSLYKNNNIHEMNGNNTSINKKDIDCSQSNSSLKEYKNTHYKFLIKLMEMLKNQQISNIISWNTTGDIIYIRDEKKFIDEVLPKYFKHNNMANFIRQLNMYSFKKLKQYSKQGIIAYSNNLFLRDNPGEMSKISRKAINHHLEINGNDKNTESNNTMLINQVNSQQDNNIYQQVQLNSINEGGKYNFLLSKLSDLEGKIKSIENENQLIDNLNKTNNKDLSIKDDYIQKLEYLIYFIINYLISSKKKEELIKDFYLLKKNNEEDNSSFSDSKNDELKISNGNCDEILKSNFTQPNNDLLNIYKNASSDYLNGNLNSLPLTNEYLRLINLRMDMKKDEFLSTKRYLDKNEKEKNKEKEMEMDNVEENEKEIQLEIKEEEENNEGKQKNCDIDIILNILIEKFKTFVKNSQNKIKTSKEMKSELIKKSNFNSNVFKSISDLNVENENDQAKINHSNKSNIRKQESIISNFELNPYIRHQISSFTSSGNDNLFTNDSNFFSHLNLNKSLFDKTKSFTSSRDNKDNTKDEYFTTDQ